MSSRACPNSSSASALANTMRNPRSAATVASGRPSSTARSAVGASDSPSLSTRAQRMGNASALAMGLGPHRVPAQPVVVTPPTPAGLLRVEHAVAAALVEDAPMEDVLGAIAGGLGWHYGGAWLPQAGAGGPGGPRGPPGGGPVGPPPPRPGARLRGGPPRRAAG